MTTCVSLDCPFICYCKEYNYTVDRGERCEHMEQIIRKATRFDKQRKKAKAVLISIRPKWCELIANGKKTVEVRKTAPKLQTPFKCYIYETLDKKYENIGVYDPNAPLYKNFVHYPGKVIGEFICANIRPVLAGYIHGACLTYDGIANYLGRNGHGCGLEIIDLVIYDNPKELGEFRSWNTGVVFKDGYPMPTHEIKRPPQSFMYVEELT